MNKKVFKRKLAVFLAFFFGATMAYFVWLTWSKLTEYIGDANTIWLITGGIVIFGITTGYLSIRRLTEGFS